MMILHSYSLQTFISHQNRQCHHSRNHHWHRWLLTSSCFAWSGQPCRMHHLVDFSSLPQDLFQSTPRGFLKSHCVTVWHKYEGQYRCNTSGEMWIVTKLGWKAPKLSTFDLSNTINFWKSHWVTVSLCDMNMKGNIVTKWQTL